MEEQRPFTARRIAPVRKLLFGLDISNYTGPLTLEQAQTWKRMGMGRVTVQAVAPPAPYPLGCTRQQLAMLLQAGIDVEAYIYLWFGLSVSDVLGKLTLLANTGVKRVWLDLEDTTWRGPLSKKNAAIEKAVAAIEQAGYEFAGVYTGWWFWTGYMDNTTRWKDVPLWDAHYDGVADPEVGFVRYGGWAKCQRKQYAGTSTIAGVGNVDLDVEIG